MFTDGAADTIIVISLEVMLIGFAHGNDDVRTQLTLLLLAKVEF